MCLLIALTAGQCGAGHAGEQRCWLPLGMATLVPSPISVGVLVIRLGTTQGSSLFCDSGKGCMHPGQNIADHAFQAVTGRQWHIALLWRCVMLRPRPEAEHRGQQSYVRLIGDAHLQVQKQC